MAARTVSEIENSIIAEKENNRPSLVDLTSTSSASSWRMWVNVVANVTHDHEVLWDVFKQEVTDAADSAVPGTERWFVGRIVDYFQYDISTPQVLEVDPDTYQFYYPVVDTTKRLVTKAACTTENDQTVSIKAAKGTAGNLVPLASVELDSLTSYIDQIKFAGQKTSVVSIFPDRVLVNMEVFIDGQYVSSVVFQDVLSAINDYLASLEFDGKIYYQKIEAAVLGVDGVKDINTAYIWRRGVSDTGWNPVHTSIDLKAGYAILEDTSGVTPTDTITITVQ